MISMKNDLSMVIQAVRDAHSIRSPVCSLQCLHHILRFVISVTSRDPLGYDSLSLINQGAGASAEIRKLTRSYPHSRNIPVYSVENLLVLEIWFPTWFDAAKTHTIQKAEATERICTTKFEVWTVTFPLE